MDEQTELLREMCDLLRLIAEPALAKRDKVRRAVLKELAGRSKTKSLLTNPHWLQSIARLILKPLIG
jgi:hypothetical protein